LVAMCCCLCNNTHMDASPFFITEFSMTTISMKSSKADIINEAVPLIEDQAEQIQDLKEKLNAAFILLGVTAALAALF